MIRHRVRRGAAGALAITSLVTAVGLLATPGAEAGGKPMPAKQGIDIQAKATAAAQVVRDLGGRSAGFYYSPRGHTMVVNITVPRDAAAVRAAGAQARTVRYSSAQLRVVTRALAARASIPGTSWGINVRTNRVHVTADRTVSPREMARLRSVTQQYPARTSLARIPGRLTMFGKGGEAIYVSSFRCSLGFNVTDGSSYYFLTAGHCTNLGSSWYADPGHTQFIGTTAGSSFPGDDYGIVKYTSGVKHPGTIYLYPGKQNVKDATNAFVGESVRRSGSTTHVHSGSVQALNQTVNYSEGTVFGLIRTNVCAEGGDSGGPLFDGNHALGLTSGGNGNCSIGGTTYFQPVTEPLGVYGVDVF